MTKWEFSPGQKLLGACGAIDLDSVDAEADGNGMWKYNIGVIAQHFWQVECVCSHVRDAPLSRLVNVFQEKFYRGEKTGLKCVLYQPMPWDLLLMHKNEERRKYVEHQHSNTVWPTTLHLSVLHSYRLHPSNCELK